jgi:hypothetical protein
MLTVAGGASTGPAAAGVLVVELRQTAATNTDMTSNSPHKTP